MASGYPDFEGGKSKLFTVAEWAALEATDKNFSASGEDVAFGLDAGLVYTVPAGKKLYITQIACSLSAYLEADGDNNQICRLYLWNETDDEYTAIIGGNGGAMMVFNKPIVFEAGIIVWIFVTQKANHNCDVWLFGSGYEV